MIPNAQDFPHLQPLWRGIPGFFDFEDLYEQVAAEVNEGSVLVEVGSFLGRSACFLGERLKAHGKNATLICVDTWPATYSEGLREPIECPFDIFYANVRQAGLLDTIVPIRVASVHASCFIRNHLDFVFIDAAHDYESCKEDILAWISNVRPGGIIAGHDFDGTFPGVMQAVREVFGSRFSVMNRSWIHRVA